MQKAYIDTVRLLLDAAPAVFEGGVFAMKGGTAINLFVHDMPRLSVDIDLVYPDWSSPRDEERVLAGGGDGGRRSLSLVAAARFARVDGDVVDRPLEEPRGRGGILPSEIGPVNSGLQPLRSGQ
jgi:hypothetical protein